MLRAQIAESPGSKVVIRTFNITFTSTSAVSADLQIHSGKDYPGPVPESMEDLTVSIAVCAHSVLPQGHQICNSFSGELFLLEISTLSISQTP